MIQPEWATVIIIIFILLFGVVVPILNRKAPKYISYRWCVIVVVLALLIGAVIDFDILSDDARRVLLIGGLVTVGVYVVLRTLEKALANGWLKGSSIEAQKGDMKVIIHGEQSGGEK